jgi:hypothetical protein
MKRDQVKRYTDREIAAAKLLIRTLEFAQSDELVKADAQRLMRDILAADFHGIGLSVDDTFAPKKDDGTNYEPEINLLIWQATLRNTFNEAILAPRKERPRLPAEFQPFFVVGPINAAASLNPGDPMLTLMADVDSLIQVQVITLLRFVGVDRLRVCRCGRMFLYHRHGGSRDYCSPKCQKHFYRKDNPMLPSPRRNKK